MCVEHATTLYVILLLLSIALAIDLSLLFSLLIAMDIYTYVVFRWILINVIWHVIVRQLLKEPRSIPTT